jgi:hypothetical protein
MEHRVHQRPTVVLETARAGVDGHASGFVDHGEVWVIEDHVEFYGFGFRLNARAHGRAKHAYMFAVLQPLRGARYVVSDKHGSGTDQLLHARATYLGHPLRKKPIEAKPDIGGTHHKNLSVHAAILGVDDFYASDCCASCVYSCES